MPRQLLWMGTSAANIIDDRPRAPAASGTSFLGAKRDGKLIISRVMIDRFAVISRPLFFPGVWFVQPFCFCPGLAGCLCCVFWIWIIGNRSVSLDIITRCWKRFSRESERWEELSGKQYGIVVGSFIVSSFNKVPRVRPLASSSRYVLRWRGCW